MASTDVKIKFIGDAKDLEKALKGLDKDLLSVGETATKSGAGFGAFAKKAGIGLGAVAVGGVADEWDQVRHPAPPARGSRGSAPGARRGGG